jgi:hypothetical protein
MRGGVRTYIYIQPPAGGRIRSKVIKCDAYCVAIMNGRRGGFINIKDMYNTDGGQGGVRVYEAHEVKKRVALIRVPFYFLNLWLITDRHRFCTYLYY